MVDIHSHILYGVDDGAESLEEAAAMLKEAKRQGISSVVLTPHYRYGMFSFPAEQIKKHFYQLNSYAENIGIKLYLGTEYHIDSQCVARLRQGRCLTLAGSPYVLAEFSYRTTCKFMRNSVNELLTYGYIPVIAHVERYRELRSHPGYIEELRELGAWIQVNADAVLGKEGRNTKRFTKKLLKKDWVDVIASDSHGIQKRKCHMKECRDYIIKKYGEEKAKKLFEKNPSRIIEKLR